MSGSDYTIKHWQQRANFAERRLEAFQQQQLPSSPKASPRVSEIGLDMPSIPLQLLTAINSTLGLSLQAHDVPAAAAAISNFNDLLVESERKSEMLHSLHASMARQAVALDHVGRVQAELEGSVDTIEALQLEIEQLRHQNAAINEQLLDSRQECDTLQVANRRLEQQAESLGLKEDIIRTFEIQLRARDDQISGMDVELNACYQRLGQNESAYRERSKQEKHTTRLKDELIMSFQEQMRSRDQHVAEMTAELSACYARLEESDSLLESACVTLQDNVKLAQEEAAKVAQIDAGILMSAGKYFNKHDHSNGALSLSPSGSHSNRTGSNNSSPLSPSTSAAFSPPSATSVDGPPAPPVVLQLNRMAV